MGPRRAGGSVWNWGWNDNGQLGDGSSSTSNTVPVLSLVD
ncbi:MAG TPA: RCC1 domain-containing protein [Archangium sp.]|nr:RCC1 domain-containing protein [Archangium sp.]